MKKIDFDRYADSYAPLLHEQTAFFVDDETYFARYKAALAKKIVSSPVARVLEFGCGIGQNIPHLKQAFPESDIVGSDISRKSIDVARALNPGVHFWIEGEAEGECTGFDLIFVAGVLHHIPPKERLTALKVIRNRLVAGGKVIIFEHNPINPITRKIVKDCPYDEDVVLIRRSELAGVMTGAGLRPIRMGYSLFVPPKLKALLPLESLLAWLPLGGQYWIYATLQ